ncbi:hypothetical protein ACIRNI_25760 [Streptomyces sp. NPDC093546]|uniref:hypothetical protein n=1 Tax=Streptomyces sp. NPDC093546 TaxID=3366040 RepID=UPI00381FAF89
MVAHPTSPDFRPTHVVPRGGLPAWDAPDRARPTAPLDPFLPVQLMDRVGDWGRILCSNGWTAWVDGRLLVSVPADPPAAGQPASRAADPRPLLGRAEDALGRYRRAAEELASGRTDGEDFRRRTRGLRVGVVVDGEALWLYDAEHERWVYCDGRRMSTYAASAGPSASAAPAGSSPSAAPVAPALSAAPAAPAAPASAAPSDGPAEGDAQADPGADRDADTDTDAGSDADATRVVDPAVPVPHEPTRVVEWPGDGGGPGAGRER